MCKHASHTEISRELIEGKSYARVGKKYGMSKMALSRHFHHLARDAAKAMEKRGIQNGDDIMQMLMRHIDRVEKLMVACDEYLSDPDNPEKYDLGPRAQDITVIYDEHEDIGEGQTKTVRKKARLSALLHQELEGGAFDAQYKIADPRELIIKAAMGLRTQMQLAAEIMGILKAGSVTNNVQVNITQLMPLVSQVLVKYPEALLAVQEALSAARAG